MPRIETISAAEQSHSRGLCEQERTLSAPPADDRETVASLEPAGGIEFEVAEEGSRSERARSGERDVGLELQATGGHKRRGIGLRCDVVVELDVLRAEFDREAQVGVPLHRREEAVRVAAEHVGEGGETGGDAAEQRAAGPDPAKRLQLPLERPAEEDGVCPSGADTSSMPRAGASRASPSRAKAAKRPVAATTATRAPGRSAETARPSATR